MEFTALKFESLDERESYFRRIYQPLLGERVINELIEREFLKAPASTKYHGAYEGGLFDHSANVAEVMQALTERLQLQWSTPHSPRIIGILHDLCKIDQYVPDMNGGYAYNNETWIKGHGTKSAIYIQHLDIALSTEELMCIIYHMGAFVPEKEWSDYTRAIHNFPNVLWTHTADMIAAHIMEV